MNREEFIGDVVRHTKGGVVHCQGHPQMGKVDYGRHNCKESMEAGDGVIISYVKDHDRGDEEWYQRFRFCANCDDARRLPKEGRQVGKEQAVVKGTLEHFEGTVEGNSTMTRFVSSTLKYWHTVPNQRVSSSPSSPIFPKAFDSR